MSALWVVVTIAINRLVGIPNVYLYGVEGDYTFLVMDLLGKSIGDLFIECRHLFSLKTVLMIVCQTVPFTLIL